MQNEHLYIDGGIIYDFSVNFFDNPPFHTTNNGENPKTLGFIVDNKAIDSAESTLDYGDPLEKYLSAIYQTIVDGQISVVELAPDESKRIVTIEIDGDTNFSLTNAQKRDLYNRGIRYTNLFLKNKYKKHNQY